MQETTEGKGETSPNNMENHQDRSLVTTIVTEIRNWRQYAHYIN